MGFAINLDTGCLLKECRARDKEIAPPYVGDSPRLG